jgi:hypothetical protein
MGLLNRLGVVDTPKEVNQALEDQLNLEELEFLLRTLKSSNLVGDQVEMFYSMVIKLQTQYTKLAN